MVAQSAIDDGNWLTSHIYNMRWIERPMLLSWLIAGGTAFAQDHTIIALSHSNHTVYEVDPATGKVLHEFVAPDQPHEAASGAAE